jgi:TolB protein
MSSSTFSSTSIPFGEFTLQAQPGLAPGASRVIYNPADQTYTFISSASSAECGLHAFHLLCKPIQGDFILQAALDFSVFDTNTVCAAGLMVRDALNTQASYAAGIVHSDTRTALECSGQGRLELSSFHPTHIQLERSGNTLTFSAAVWGESFKSVSHSVALPDATYAGLFFCPQADQTTAGSAQVVLSNVRVILPAAPDFKPYQDYIGSHLEVMDVATGHRTVLHSEPGSIQAPNWTPDNQLLYNSAAGVMYRYDLASGKIAEIETGAQRNNNNDHVLSFDGSMLALSNFDPLPADPRQTRSVAYVLPTSGAPQPRRITRPQDGHTFLHGWSPDGTKLVFTGDRHGQTGDFRNLWSVDIHTLQETALTPPLTLDDGPEYSPDGKTIYFNSVRTGTMQIWRMQPDGSQPEQITFDAYNNWFPHISPDGQWMVYLAFPAEIDPWSHPFYQHCAIRLMPVTGGVPRTIAYVYAGQGSMNTPGWSPDSKRIAFVSNSRL